MIIRNAANYVKKLISEFDIKKFIILFLAKLVIGHAISFIPIYGTMLSLVFCLCWDLYFRSLPGLAWDVWPLLYDLFIYLSLLC